MSFSGDFLDVSDCQENIMNFPLLGLICKKPTHVLHMLYTCTQMCTLLGMGDIDNLVLDYCEAKYHDYRDYCFDFINVENCLQMYPNVIQKHLNIVKLSISVIITLLHNCC